MNMAANIFAFLVNLSISFLLTPYIVKRVGIDAYGFVSLGSNFVSYLQMFTIALNSMAGRFIMVRIVQNDKDGANRFFSTLVLSNALIAIVSVIPVSLLLFFLDRIVKIPLDLLVDVRLLWIFIFLNFLIGLVTSVFSVATFSVERLDLTSLREVEANLLKVVSLLLLFLFFTPKVWYIGFASVVFTLYTSITHVYYTKKFLPYIKVKKKYFDKESVKVLLSSGIWNTINRMGQLMLEGIDLLIANLFIGPVGMGILALSKTLPNIISTLIGVLANVFNPRFTSEYAKGNNDTFVSHVKQSIKIMSVFINIPVCILAVFGGEFFRLWVPGQNAEQLQVLSLIACAGLVFTGGTNTIFGVFTAVNQLKYNSISIIITGVLNTITVLILLKTTSLGLYAIAGISTVFITIKNVVFVIPYAAKLLQQKPLVFHPIIVKSAVSFFIALAIGFGVKYIIHADTWLTLFFAAGITGSVGLGINLIVIIGTRQLKETIASFKHK